MKSLSFAICGNLLKTLSLLASILPIFAIPSQASVVVSSPYNGSEVETPFSLSAAASTCSSQTVTAMGYSLDSSVDATVINGTAVEARVAVRAGTHTLHVKAWGNRGSSCVTDVAITVSASPSGPVAPWNATSVSSIQALSNWQSAHDDGGSGSSSGKMHLVNSPSLSGSAREFVTQFSSNGDERFSVTFGDDTKSTNFLYDAWVYFNNSINSIGNLEMDLNQVMPNGENAIFAVQCAGDSGTWDYTRNAGTPHNPVVKWEQSKAKCNPRSWSTNIWHHVQISYSRDNSGNVTYQSVWLDGTQQNINATVPSAFALGWPPTMQTQFQVDGNRGNGTTTVYLDDLTIFRW